MSLITNYKTVGAMCYYEGSIRHSLTGEELEYDRYDYAYSVIPDEFFEHHADICGELKNVGDYKKRLVVDYLYMINERIDETTSEDLRLYVAARDYVFAPNPPKKGAYEVVVIENFIETICNVQKEETCTLNVVPEDISRIECTKKQESEVLDSGNEIITLQMSEPLVFLTKESFNDCAIKRFIEKYNFDDDLIFQNTYIRNKHLRCDNNLIGEDDEHLCACDCDLINNYDFFSDGTKCRIQAHTGSCSGLKNAQFDSIKELCEKNIYHDSDDSIEVERSTLNLSTVASKVLSNDDDELYLSVDVGKQVVSDMVQHDDTSLYSSNVYDMSLIMDDLSSFDSSQRRLGEIFGKVVQEYPLIGGSGNRGGGGRGRRRRHDIKTRGNRFVVKKRKDIASNLDTMNIDSGVRGKLYKEIYSSVLTYDKFLWNGEFDLEGGSDWSGQVLNWSYSSNPYMVTNVLRDKRNEVDGFDASFTNHDTACIRSVKLKLNFMSHIDDSLSIMVWGGSRNIKVDSLTLAELDMTMINDESNRVYDIDPLGEKTITFNISWNDVYSRNIESSLCWNKSPSSPPLYYINIALFGLKEWPEEVGNVVSYVEYDVAWDICH